jgi:hypothetical protein
MYNSVPETYVAYLWHDLVLQLLLFKQVPVPNVIVLQSEGLVFSSGRDLGELKKLPHNQVQETFALCAEVMKLIRRSPAPVVGVIQGGWASKSGGLDGCMCAVFLCVNVTPTTGLATAAGAQLALSTNFSITLASNPFRFPGASTHIPFNHNIPPPEPRPSIPHASNGRTRPRSSAE